MHATIRIYAASGDLVDRLVANESAIRDLLTGIDGFRMYHLLRTADGTASISIFDTEEGTAESTRVAADWIRENLPDYTGAPPQVVSGDVVVDF